MAHLGWRRVWDSHPGEGTFPCDMTLFGNQCAIRMGIALAGAGANLRDFVGARCYPGLKHSPKHILRAQELANWLAGQVGLVGRVARNDDATAAAYANRTGIIFVKNGWGPTDHIDVWNGVRMKAGEADWIGLGEEVWFWALS